MGTLPHGPDAGAAAAPDVDAPLRPLVINLRDAAVEGAFDPVVEVVPADESARGAMEALPGPWPGTEQVRHVTTLFSR